MKKIESEETHRLNGFKKASEEKPIVNSVGKSDKLFLELNNRVVIEGYYSAVAGFATTPSFYQEHLLDDEYVIWWKYEKEPDIPVASARKEVKKEYTNSVHNTELGEYIFNYMRSHNIYVGNSEFASQLREIADYVDD